MTYIGFIIVVYYIFGIITLQNVRKNTIQWF